MKVGLGLPRGMGDPTRLGEPSHRVMVAAAQRAESLGFDSVWVPDHFYFEREPGIFEPYPEAWTVMAAAAATTQRVQIGSMVLAAAFRHPAMLAKMAGAVQELSGGRLLLGVGAGNQIGEHTAFGLGFERRVGRFDEYLQIVHGLLAGEQVTLDGQHYQLRDASLLMSHPPVPLVIAAMGERMLRLTVRYASGWNAGGTARPDGEPFRTRLAALHEACRAAGRDPAEIEVSFMISVLVSDDPDETAAQVGAMQRQSAEQVHGRVIIGTPAQVTERLARTAEWGAQHLIVSLGASPFTFWDDAMPERFAREVLPALQSI